MEYRNLSLRHFQPPTSGKIIGVLVMLLCEKPAVLKTRQARRFFDGEIVSPKQQRKIFNSFANAILDTAMIPRSALEGLPFPSSEIIASGITLYSEQWDHLGAYTYSHSGRVFQERDAAMAYLRLVVIDIAVRGVALLWLMDAPEPGNGTPMWAKELGVAHWLRESLADAGLTREKFAEFADVSERAVDTWLDEGIRPSAINIERISEVLWDHSPQQPPQRYRELLGRNYFLSGMCDLLVPVIGRRNVEMLADALCVLISRVLPDFRSVKPPSDELARAIQMETLLLGCEASRAKHILDLMWKQEGNSEWRIDIQAAKINWVQRLQHQIARLGTPDSEGPILHRSGVARVAQDAILEVAAKSFEALAKGEQNVALRARLEVVEILKASLRVTPDDPWLHFQLGSILNDLGDVDGAVNECWLAAALEPNWELPLDEIGVIYFNASRFDEAKRHLEDIVGRKPNPGWDRLMKLGIARMRTGDAAGGLNALEMALDIEPNHPIVLSAAARCAFLLGQKVKSRRYKKRAQLFGDWSDPMAIES